MCGYTGRQCPPVRTFQVPRLLLSKVCPTGQKERE